MMRALLGTATTAIGLLAACSGDDPAPSGPPPAPPAAEEPAGDAVPSAPAALLEWLRARSYASYRGESSVHASSGPHGGNVRTFVNAKLAASLDASGEHPEGSVAVKELYGSGTTDVTGWAVMIKTQPESAAGAGFYWYEVFGTEPGASAIEGQGKGLCVDCHAGGRDFFLTPFPLR